MRSLVAVPEFLSFLLRLVADVGPPAGWPAGKCARNVRTETRWAASCCEPSARRFPCRRSSFRPSGSRGAERGMAPPTTAMCRGARPEAGAAAGRPAHAARVPVRGTRSAVAVRLWSPKPRRARDRLSAHRGKIRGTGPSATAGPSPARKGRPRPTERQRRADRHPTPSEAEFRWSDGHRPGR